MTAVLQFSPRPRAPSPLAINGQAILDMRTRIALLGARPEDRQDILMACIHRKISEFTEDNVIAFKGAA